MSIRPPTDIVLDVARAANPQVYKQAAARLGQTSPTSLASAVSALSPTEGPDDFTSIFNTAGVTPGDETFAPPSPLIQMPFDATSALMQMKTQSEFASVSAANKAEMAPGLAGPAVAPSKKAYEGFEAMVLSSFVESMLPTNADATFGTGTAGQIWRSMLAQQIATQMAQAGGIGIAAQLQRSEAAVGRTSPAEGLL